MNRKRSPRKGRARRERERIDLTVAGSVYCQRRQRVCRDETSQFSGRICTQDGTKPYHTHVLTRNGTLRLPAGVMVFPGTQMRVTEDSSQGTDVALQVF